ncbi:hypothetical protein Vafri_12234 [Volvox africanus]|uniref:Uncharacterized protein n=1 Tax=Volvox africanus TaxID=51714 RepID=A0A8J4BEE3_9CHLO|nr:hypothetical protein Vafri_12234 [Volvox africanus]
MSLTSDFSRLCVTSRQTRPGATAHSTGNLCGAVDEIDWAADLAKLEGDDATYVPEEGYGAEDKVNRRVNNDALQYVTATAAEGATADAAGTSALPAPRAVHRPERHDKSGNDADACSLRGDGSREETGPPSRAATALPLSGARSISSTIPHSNATSHAVPQSLVPFEELSKDRSPSRIRPISHIQI